MQHSTNSSFSPLLIASKQGDYQVEFVENFSELQSALKEFSSLDSLIVDENISSLYQKFLSNLNISSQNICKIQPTETEKTLVGVSKVLDFFQSNRVSRSTVVTAMGGGIVQDIAAFACHIYYRGLNWVYCPTTLLSMCDSCIGAKCGINYNGFKNQLGVFHAPKRVFICLDFLQTLSETDIHSGYGEILKLLLTGPEVQYQFLRETLQSSGKLRNDQLPQLIYESLKVKKEVIEKDEYEEDLRRILNYGHTFGHALESITHHAVPHGLAVAWGVDIANYFSWQLGMLTESRFLEIHKLIETHFKIEYFKTHSLDAESLIGAMRQDKKANSDSVNLILTEGPGRLKIRPTKFDDQFKNIVSQYISLYHGLHRN